MVDLAGALAAADSAAKAVRTSTPSPAASALDITGAMAAADNAVKALNTTPTGMEEAFQKADAAALLADSNPTAASLTNTADQALTLKQPSGQPTPTQELTQGPRAGILSGVKQGVEAAAEPFLPTPTTDEMGNIQGMRPPPVASALQALGERAVGADATGAEQNVLADLQAQQTRQDSEPYVEPYSPAWFAKNAAQFGGMVLPLVGGARVGSTVAETGARKLAEREAEQVAAHEAAVAASGGVITETAPVLPAVGSIAPETAGKIGTVAGMAAADLPLRVGEQAQQQIATTGQVVQPQNALFAGGALSALDVLSPEALGLKLGLTDGPVLRKFVGNLNEQLRNTSLIPQIIGGAAKGAIELGAISELQSEVDIAARKTYDEHFTKDDANKQRLEGLLSGAMLGGFFGGTVHGVDGLGRAMDTFGRPDPRAALVMKRDQLRQDVHQWEQENDVPEGTFLPQNNLIANEDQQIRSMNHEAARASFYTDTLDHTTGKQYDPAQQPAGTVRIVGADNPTMLQPLARQAERWVKKFFPEAKLTLSDKDLPFEPLLDHATQGYAIVNLGDGLSHITLNPKSRYMTDTLDKDIDYEVLAHEFGHAIIHQAIQNADHTTQRALMQAYANDLAQVTREHTPDDLKGTFVTGTDDPSLTSEPAVKNWGARQRNYQLSLTEWIAHRASNLLTTKHDDAADHFFSAIRSKIKTFYDIQQGPKLRPDHTYESFLRSLATRADLAELDRQLPRFNPFIGEGEQMFRGEGPLISQTPWMYADADGKLSIHVPVSGDVVVYDPVGKRGVVDAHNGITLNKGMTPGEPIAYRWETAEGETQLATNLRAKGYIYRERNGQSYLVQPSSDPSIKGTILAATTGMKRGAEKVAALSAQLSKGKGAPGGNWVDRLKLEQDFFSNFIANVWAVHQILRMNRHIPGIPAFTETLYRWRATKMAYVSQSEERARAWTRLGKDMGQRLSNFLLDLNGLPKHPDPVAWDAMATKAGLSDDAKQIAQQVQSDFRRVLDDMQTAAIRDINATMSPGPARDAELLRTLQEFKQLNAKPYFPLSRFGRYVVMVRDAADGRLKQMEAFESEAAQRARMQELLQTKSKTETVSASTLEEHLLPYQGLPLPILRRLRAKLSLTQKEQELLEQLAYEALPAQSFRRHFQKRNMIAGFSTNGQRAYAAYFMSAANHIARVMHDSEFNTALEHLGAHVRDLRQTNGVNSNKRSMLHKYLEDTKSLLYNPRSDFATIRSLTALWYLGLSAKSAFVNLMQVPSASYSHLAGMFGDKASVLGLGKGYRDLKKLMQGNGLDQHVLDAYQLAKEQGIVDESMAVELAKMANAGMLKRAFGGTEIEHRLGQASRLMMLMFSSAEKVNRAVTFLAAYRLALDHSARPHLQQLRHAFSNQINELVNERGMTPEQAIAYISARDAVQISQGEYAKEFRPRLMQGKASILTVFKMFQQNMLWLMRHEPGGKRYLATQLLLAGAMGMPFAQDASNIIKWLVRLTTGKDFDAETEMAGYLHDVVSDVAPDWFLHGISRHGLGVPQLSAWAGIPLPEFDLSGSFSMGDIVPGTRALPELVPGGDANQAMSYLAQDLGGAGLSIPFGIMQAVTSTDPNVWKRVQKALPTALANISRTYQLVQGGPTDRTGATIAPYDMHDPIQATEAIGQALGFTPTRVTETWTQIAKEKEAQTYLNIRRQSVLQEMAQAMMEGDREAIADSMQHLRDFNQQMIDAGNPLAIIGARSLQSSIRNSIRNRVFKEQGIPTQRMFIPLHNEFEQTFPVDEPLPRGNGGQSDE